MISYHMIVRAPGTSQRLVELYGLLLRKYYYCSRCRYDVLCATSESRTFSKNLFVWRWFYGDPMMENGWRGVLLLLFVLLCSCAVVP